MPSQPLDNFKDYYLVERDPDPVGGFSKGAKLSAESVANMLATGGFTEGTTVRRGYRGALMKVQRAGPVRQVLEEVNR